MVPRRPRSMLILWVLLVPVLAGCLDADASLEADNGTDAEGGDPGEAQDGAEPGPYLLLGAHNVSLAPWFDHSRQVVSEPDEGTLIQVAGIHQDDVLLRLLFDGSAFVLSGRLTEKSVPPQGIVYLVKVSEAATGTEVARDAIEVYTKDGAFVMELPAFERTRMNTAYALEVYAFHWGRLVVDCARGTPCDHPPPDPVAPLVDGREWQGTEGTVVEHRPVLVWQTQLSLTSRATVTLDGPSEATDRPDAVESKYALGPETGTYTINVTGVRIWRADLLLEFQDSRVHATRPEAYGNGSSSLEVFLSGHIPLDAWRGMPADEGFEQSFTLEVDIDHETGNGDVPQDGQQYFFATLQHGYRIDGSTYVAGSSGADLGVDVRAQ